MDDLTGLLHLFLVYSSQPMDKPDHSRAVGGHRGKNHFLKKKPFKMIIRVIRRCSLNPS